jgi:protein-disulfide isomerase
MYISPLAWNRRRYPLHAPARKQGKFEETLEAAYSSQSAWASHHNPQPQRLWMRLGNVDLNFSKAKTDLDDPETIRRMQQDLADARQLQVTKTPSFFVNGKPLVRFGYEQLRILIESELARVY